MGHDYKTCPHREAVRPEPRDERKERASCAFFRSIIGYRWGVGQGICETCGKWDMDLAHNPRLQSLREKLLIKIPFRGPLRVRDAHEWRKRAITELVKTDGYTLTQIQKLILDAAAKATIMEGEVAELDDHAREQIDARDTSP